MFIYKKNQGIINVVNYHKKNFVGLFGILLIAIGISYYSGKHYINSIITIIISTFVTWIGHFLMHNYNTYNPISWLHAITHHSPFGDTFIGKLIEYVFIEFIFFGGGLLLFLVIIIHKIYNVYILNPYVILCWSIAVPYIHEVHYHILNISSFHKLHHLDTNYNYSSDYWDVVMNRKQDETPIENETLILPHLLLIAVFVVYIIDTKYDFIKYFSK